MLSSADEAQTSNVICFQVQILWTKIPLIKKIQSVALHRNIRKVGLVLFIILISKNLKCRDWFRIVGILT